MQFLYLIPVAAALGGLVIFALILAVLYRVVVPTNFVHIVQRNKSTVPYGAGQPGGNVYYKWPSWVPRFGITRIVLPLSNFDVDLSGYSGYDKDRVPFNVDVMAFFRIAEPSVTAERIASIDELIDQLTGILQGAIRSVLAANKIDQILELRSEFGEQFTAQVDVQLREWGVHSVKNIELMDIRDADGSKVIANIMEKQKSFIEMESRVAVAENIKNAQNAETVAGREVDMVKQEALEQVGKRTADQEKVVGIQMEQSKQAVAEQAKITAEKNMAVKQVNDTRAAEIARTVAVTAADQQAQEQAKKAEGEFKAAEFEASAVKVKALADSEATRVKGTAEADIVRAKGEAEGAAEQAMQMAPVNAQISLAEKIAELSAYQEYLVKVRGIEAQQAIGVENAKAFAAADIKVIANSGNAPNAINSLVDVLTPQGGTQLGAMIEAFKQTEAGQRIIDAVVATPPSEETPAPGKRKRA